VLPLSAVPSCLGIGRVGPTLLYEVSVSRQSLIYSLKILIPQLVLTMVAFSTFWLSPQCGER
jgi:hypothetical protein